MCTDGISRLGPNLDDRDQCRRIGIPRYLVSLQGSSVEEEQERGRRERTKYIEFHEDTDVYLRVSRASRQPPGSE